MHDDARHPRARRSPLLAPPAITTASAAAGIPTWLALLVFAAGPAHAQRPYTAADTFNAIDEVAAEFAPDVSWHRLFFIVRCESGGTFDPYSVGRAGELGVAQLHQPRTVGKPRQHVGRHLDRQAGLADPADPRDRHDPRRLQRLRHVSHGRVPSHEPGRRERQDSQDSITLG